MANWFAYNKYKAKPVWWCLTCNIEAQAQGEGTRCRTCKKKPQRFASTQEFKRYQELRLMEKFGDITDLVVQPRFPLTVNGSLICTYIADFQYKNKDGKVIVEDSKGMVTPIYRIKKKLMHAIFNVEIFET